MQRYTFFVIWCFSQFVINTGCCPVLMDLQLTADFHLRPERATIISVGYHPTKKIIINHKNHSSDEKDFQDQPSRQS